MNSKKRFNTNPIDPLKIKLIQDMLSDPIVYESYIRFVNGTQGKARTDAFNEYCKARDSFLGLPPLIVPSVQGTHARYRT